MSSEENTSPRQKIIATAAPLFYREGYRAVGIDKIIAQSGVAKATFYKHFPSKDDLMVAWVERAGAQSKSMFEAAIGDTPLFDYVDRVLTIAATTTCYGCTFQGTASEFPSPSHPAHAASIKVKTDVIATLQHLAARQGIANPEHCGEIVFVLLEGVWASVRMFGAKAPLGQIKAAVRKLVAQ